MAGLHGPKGGQRTKAGGGLSRSVPDDVRLNYLIEDSYTFLNGRGEREGKSIVYNDLWEARQRPGNFVILGGGKKTVPHIKYIRGEKKRKKQKKKKRSFMDRNLRSWI